MPSNVTLPDDGAAGLLDDSGWLSGSMGKADETDDGDELAEDSGADQ